MSKIWTSGDLQQKKRKQRLVFPSGIGYDKQNDAVRTLKQIRYSLKYQAHKGNC